ncbi:basic proline-rich protein-like [Moschus berezovskii]|uniref:basic proline-rich protein-like n=1 Tax=Moschus berezovskii TaxID=68408 RepID=UPI0024446F0D|nr:basic proline-rich protein-like [Moschus berezovskii]
MGLRAGDHWPQEMVSPPEPESGDFSSVGRPPTVTITPDREGPLMEKAPVPLMTPAVLILKTFAVTSAHSYFDPSSWPPDGGQHTSLESLDPDMRQAEGGTEAGETALPPAPSHRHSECLGRWEKTSKPSCPQGHGDRVAGNPCLPLPWGEGRHRAPAPTERRVTEPGPRADSTLQTPPRPRLHPRPDTSPPDSTPDPRLHPRPRLPPQILPLPQTPPPGSTPPRLHPAPDSTPTPPPPDSTPAQTPPPLNASEGLSGLGFYLCPTLGPEQGTVKAAI